MVSFLLTLFVLLVQHVGPYTGLVGGWSILPATDATDREENQFLVSIVVLSIVIGPVGWIASSMLMSHIENKTVWLPPSELITWFVCAGIGLATSYFWHARIRPAWADWKFSHGRKSAHERETKTDIRTVREQLPAAMEPFDPLPYIAGSDEIFIGLDSAEKPVTVPYEYFRTSHAQIVGTTGAGKGVVSAILLSQALDHGEAVFVLDPKNDEWAPHVLRAACERSGKPFHFVDLNDEAQQIDLLAEMTQRQINELFVSGFSLAEKGEAADFYRIGDREAARETATMIAERPELDSFSAAVADEAVQDLISRAIKADGFRGKLKELALLKSINAPGGLNLADIVRDGGCVYVVGSMREAVVIMAQRMLLIRLIQVAETRDRVAGDPRPICIFADEVKYHISKPFMESLGAARDKGVHVLLAHQSKEDLRDCPSDLNKDAVVGSVVENCKLRIAYKAQDPDTAEWLARMTGTIIVDDEVRSVDRNAALQDEISEERTIKASDRYLIDENMFLSLPKGVGILFSADLPKPVHVSPLRSEKKPLEIYGSYRDAPVSEPAIQ